MTPSGCSTRIARSKSDGRLYASWWATTVIVALACFDSSRPYVRMAWTMNSFRSASVQSWLAPPSFSSMRMLDRSWARVVIGATGGRAPRPPGTGRVPLSPRLFQGLALHGIQQAIQEAADPVVRSLATHQAKVLALLVGKHQTCTALASHLLHSTCQSQVSSSKSQVQRVDLGPGTWDLRLD